MIPEEQLEEIRRLLDESQKPLFFFDDDTDGLCSYLVLKKYVQRGKGVIVKCSPILDIKYLKKIEEFRPDRVFILDKPIIEQEFADNTNVPLVWIDHHPPAEIEGVKYFNPQLKDRKDNRPATYWCYKVVKKYLWVAMCGIIGDWHIPEKSMMDELKESYPGIIGEETTPGEIIYNGSDFGKLIRIFSFALKGKTSDVHKFISILEKIESPYEILRQETPRGKLIYMYFEKINRQYQKLLNSAKKMAEKSDFIVFTYPMGKMSFSGDLANELLHIYPDKFIMIGRIKPETIAVSMRDKHRNLQPIVKEALNGVEGYGGGHEHACGGCISRKDFAIFAENMKSLLEKKA